MERETGFCMKPWVTLDSVDLPSGEKMTLIRRAGEFIIELDGCELMSNTLTGSEESLATEALKRIEGRADDILW